MSCASVWSSEKVGSSSLGWPHALVLLVLSSRVRDLQLNVAQFSPSGNACQQSLPCQYFHSARLVSARFKGKVLQLMPGCATLGCDFGKKSLTSLRWASRNSQMWCCQACLRSFILITIANETGPRNVRMRHVRLRLNLKVVLLEKNLCSQHHLITETTNKDTPTQNHIQPHPRPVSCGPDVDEKSPPIAPSLKQQYSQLLSLVFAWNSDNVTLTRWSKQKLGLCAAEQINCLLSTRICAECVLVGLSVCFVSAEFKSIGNGPTLFSDYASRCRNAFAKPKTRSCLTNTRTVVNNFPLRKYSPDQQFPVSRGNQKRSAWRADFHVTSESRKRLPTCDNDGFESFRPATLGFRRINGTTAPEHRLRLRLPCLGSSGRR